MVSRVGSIIGNRSAELAEWVEVLKTVQKGKFRYSSSPTIIAQATAPAQSNSLGNSGDGEWGRKERPAEQDKGNCSNDI